MSFIIASIINVLDCFGVIDILYYIGDKPYKKYDGDAGFDLYVSESSMVEPKSGCNIKVNTSITSRRMWMLLIGRSSTFYKRGLVVNTAIIDNGYTGDLHVYVYNHNEYGVFISAGDRIAQIIPFKLSKPLIVNGVCKKISCRGGDGFGSTGA